MTRKATIVTILLLLFAGITGFYVHAQQQNLESGENISDRELENFAEAYTKVQQKLEEFNTNSAQAVEDSSFDQETFQRLYQEQSMGNQEEFNRLNQSEKKEFEQLIVKIQELQKGFEEDMVEAVEDEGLSVQKFNTIIAKIQQDPELFQRFEEVRKRQG